MGYLLSLFCALTFSILLLIFSLFLCLLGYAF